MPAYGNFHIFSVRVCVCVCVFVQLESEVAAADLATLDTLVAEVSLLKLFIPLNQIRIRFQ